MEKQAENSKQAQTQNSAGSLQENSDQKGSASSLRVDMGSSKNKNFAIVQHQRHLYQSPKSSVGS
jgi:hypothetical protein